MLGKVIIALFSLLAISNGQILSWENTQELDPNFSFRLFWTVIPEAGDIVLQVQARTVGWISLTLESRTISDVIIGGYNNTIESPFVYDMSSTINAAGSHGPLVLDDSPDVVLQRGFEYPPETVVRWKRSLKTGDSADVDIVPGPMTVSWAYSTGSDDLNAPIALAGIATVTFIPL